MSEPDPNGYFNVTLRLPDDVAEVVYSISKAIDVPPSHVASVLCALGMRSFMPEWGTAVRPGLGGIEVADEPLPSEIGP